MTDTVGYYNRNAARYVADTVEVDLSALQIPDDEFRTLASVALSASVDRDAYLQLLITDRATTKGSAGSAQCLEAAEST